MMFIALYNSKPVAITGVSQVGAQQFIVRQINARANRPVPITWTDTGKAMRILRRNGVFTQRWIGWEYKDVPTAGEYEAAAAESGALSAFGGAA